MSRCPCTVSLTLRFCSYITFHPEEQRLAAVLGIYVQTFGFLFPHTRLIFIKITPSVCRNRRGLVCHNKSAVCHNCIRKMLQRNDFLLFPVVPDVLDIVIIFHDVDELFHPKPSVSVDLQGKHWEMTLFKFDEKSCFSTNSVIPSQQLA